MKVFYILKNDSDETGKTILETHKKEHDVTVVDLRENKNYSEIVDLIESTDRVICW